MLKNNRVAFILALIMAIALWAYVLGEVDPVRTITIRNIPIRFVDQSALTENGLVITGMDHEEVSVTFTAKRSLVTKIDADDFHASDLEAILHPLVRKRLLDFQVPSASCLVPGTSCFVLGADLADPILARKQRTKHQALGTKHQAPSTKHQAPIIRIAIIPLLFESHFESDYDTILCVSSTEDRQIDRMMRTRGYTREQAEARLAAQMPVAEKAARADWTIQNNSTVEELKAEVQRCVAWLIGRMEKAE